MYSIRQGACSDFHRGKVMRVLTESQKAPRMERKAFETREWARRKREIRRTVAAAASLTEGGGGSSKLGPGSELRDS